MKYGRLWMIQNNLIAVDIKQENYENGEVEEQNV